MNLEDKFADASDTINQRFLMLIQALSGIRGLTSITVNQPEEQKLLQKVLDVLNQNLDFECCSIFLLSNNEELCCIAGKNWKDVDNELKDKKRHSHSFKIGQGIIGQAAKTGKFIIAGTAGKTKIFSQLSIPG